MAKTPIDLDELEAILNAPPPPPKPVDPEEARRKREEMLRWADDMEARLRKGPETKD